jgi:hypothetical protein
MKRNKVAAKESKLIKFNMNSHKKKRVEGGASGKQNTHRNNAPKFTQITEVKKSFLCGFLTFSNPIIGQISIIKHFCWDKLF